jgi:hypothetical protein
MCAHHQLNCQAPPLSTTPYLPAAPHIAPGRGGEPRCAYATPLLLGAVGGAGVQLRCFWSDRPSMRGARPSRPSWGTHTHPPHPHPHTPPSPRSRLRPKPTPMGAKRP